MKTKLLIGILLFIMPFTISLGQKSNKKITITGIVLDANQKPVPNAMIFIDKKKTEILTNSMGVYKIRVNPSASTIAAFTLMNGLSEAMIEGKTTINFILNASSSAVSQPVQNSADEEAINVGYGTVKKKNLTTQVGKIDATNKRFASYSNIFEMIRGEVAGVQVNGTNIVIQGPSSIMMSNQPLFVVDGIVVPTISDISPRIVKSIEVLKGSAASIYGSRGSNGVILINLMGSR
jgi:TonB-dependent SusC/RagA subfamily outer membrane receptor